MRSFSYEVKDNANMGASLLEGLLEVAVHVGCDRLNPFHPLLAHVLDERVYRGLLLSVGKPEDVARLHIYDDHRVLVPVMELELIDAEEPRLFLGLDEPLSVYGVLLLQPSEVDVLDGVLPQAGDVCNFLVGKPIGEQVPGIAQQLAADAVPLRLERDALHVAVTASGAQVAQFGELEATQPIPEAQMPQAGLAAVMDVHRASAQWAQAIICTARELSFEQVHLPV